MPAGDVEDRVDEIQAWLERSGFTVRGVDDPESHVTLEAERAEDFTYTLVHPEAGADHVYVGLALPGDGLEEALADASPEETEAFLVDMRFGLLGMGVEFEGLEVPTEHVTLFLPAYFDGLSKDRFMEKLRRVKNAGLFLDWTLGPAEEPSAPPPEPGGEHYIR